MSWIMMELHTYYLWRFTMVGIYLFHQRLSSSPFNSVFSGTIPRHINFWCRLWASWRSLESIREKKQWKCFSFSLLLHEFFIYILILNIYLKFEGLAGKQAADGLPPVFHMRRLNVWSWLPQPHSSMHVKDSAWLPFCLDHLVHICRAALLCDESMVMVMILVVMECSCQQACGPTTCRYFDFLVRDNIWQFLLTILVNFGLSLKIDFPTKPGRDYWLHCPIW